MTDTGVIFRGILVVRFEAKASRIYVHFDGMPAVDFKGCKLVSNNKGISHTHTVYYPVDLCVKQQAAVLQNQVGHFLLSTSKFRFSKLNSLFFFVPSLLCECCMFPMAWVFLSHKPDPHTPPCALLLTNQNDFHWFFQEVKHIGSSHNRSALPFTGFGPKVVTNQYNNPAGLYSSDNIKDFNSAVDEVKTMATASEANSK